MDEATGLIYVGNGQYYDPATGRFLTRDANPNSPNPYVPFDPTGLLFAPLGLMVVFYGGRKSKKSAPYMLMLMMLVVLPLTVGLACDTGTPAATTPIATATQPPGGTQVAGSATVAPTATSTPVPAIVIITPDCPTAPMNPSDEQRREYIASFGIILTPEERWTGRWLTNLELVLFTDIGAAALPSWMNHKSATLFIDKDGSATCSDDKKDCYFAMTGTDGITFYHTGTSINSEINMLHEFGHLVDNLSNSHNDFTNQLYTKTFTLNNEYWAGYSGSSYVSIPRSGDNNVYQLVLKTSPIGGDIAWQQKSPSFYGYPGHEQGEDWADIFANGIMNNINTSTEPGRQIDQFFKDMEQ